MIDLDSNKAYKIYHERPNHQGWNHRLMGDNAENVYDWLVSEGATYIEIIESGTGTVVHTEGTKTA